MTECNAPKKVPEASGSAKKQLISTQAGFSEGRDSSLVKPNGGDQRSVRL